MTTLAVLAQELGCELEGDANLRISGIAPLDEAGPEDLSYLTDPRQAAKAFSTRAAALLVGKKLPVPAREASLPPLAWLRADNPEVAVAAAVARLRPPWQ